MDRVIEGKLALLVLTIVLTATGVRAQTFKTLTVFNGSNGGTPVDTPLVQGTDGNLYGTTLGGGSPGPGTVFRMTPAGQLTTIYSFCSQPNCTDGDGPYGGLLLASDGNFYGTTSQGGASGIDGTVFRITPSGVLTTLHSFDGTDGAGPNSPLIQAANGNIYGLTAQGGSANSGTFFRMTLSGSLTMLYSFSGADLNGPLLQASDGNFYGASEWGGSNDYGMVFKLTPSGGFSVVHSFNSTDGSFPTGGLIEASDGSLYGTTYQGGSDNSCPNGCGTVFKMTLAGTLTTIHNFESTDGANPIAGLISATNGNFYGTTYAGGDSGDWGAVYEELPREVSSSSFVRTLRSDGC